MWPRMLGAHAMSFRDLPSVTRLLLLLDRFFPSAAALIALARYVVMHEEHPFRPGASSGSLGWFEWADASRYLRAALAWSHLDFRGSEHWYPPGYPFLGALGRALTPAQPFYVPDVLALMAAG